ncbi:FXYD domain-containing ion transport regulator 11 isoform X2 [Phyllopteryx taeniolatus]|uniref:FXYD domain-containing ion transport regulator 11 isoform X2 n=1 Tax=Phyllopteryx taeniolatus TaxID=161469 RepID=UPI002AD531DB|nr:FXYD domain-containing ion transport regulator 11 isoform X2 [Phyllopteryx taeniolatus]
MHVHNSLYSKQRGGPSATKSGENENKDFNPGCGFATFRQSFAPLYSSVQVSQVLKMGHLTFVAVMAVLFTLFNETEANYERLRIAGLICAGLLVIGGVGILLYNKCSRRSNKDDDSEI